MRMLKIRRVKKKGYQKGNSNDGLSSFPASIIRPSHLDILLFSSKKWEMTYGIFVALRTTYLLTCEEPNHLSFETVEEVFETQ